MVGPRLSIKAVIIRDGHILAMKGHDPWGDYYLLPGGGQRHGESVPEALQRECLEEIGTTVVIHDLRLVREYIARNHEFAAEEGDAHQVELIFDCTLPEGARPVMGSTPDVNQVSVEWLPVDRIQEYRLYPQSLRAVLVDLSASDRVFRGDVN
jgi:8-oxo-dGTP diphosphatase